MSFYHLKTQKIIVNFLLALFLTLLPVKIFAQDNADAVITYRQSLMYNLQRNLNSISEILKGNIDQQSHLAGLASILNISAAQSVDAFKQKVPNNGKSKAKPNIWQNQDDFNLEMQSLIRETAELVKLAESNDIKAFSAQLGVVGKNCASCHKAYKNR
ncbi:MAG: cytochrome c [Alphaproteobacteria bacterium]|nr:cytochrome c [Alphaproteobacteria bacterium]